MTGVQTCALPISLKPKYSRKFANRFQSELTAWKTSDAKQRDMAVLVLRLVYAVQEAQKDRKASDYTSILRQTRDQLNATLSPTSSATAARSALRYVLDNCALTRSSTCPKAPTNCI